MAWFNEAVFYHIYPLGMTGAPKINDYTLTEHRLNRLIPHIEHIKKLGCNALYIGPLFESVGHGYETTDYKKTDSRLGTNEDLRRFVELCHKNGIRVIFDGVFNHTGRDFFAFKDIQKNRENSPYRYWYNINFYGNNSYNDGFSYENWGGYDLLVKLNQKNPEVISYICDVIRFWASEFGIDGIRLDAADVLDFEFMKALRRTADEIGSDFWLMGEVIHGDYSRWANNDTLHAVTNYNLHKALYSGHNDRNYFEIAHTVKRLNGMIDSRRLYNFTDNHDVERIYTRLSDKRHFVPAHILLYTLPGIPSVYYGSEFAVEGKKQRGSDDSLRPEIRTEDYMGYIESNPFTNLISCLGKVRHENKALSAGDYKELYLTNRQYVFSRCEGGKPVIVAVNNADEDASVSFPFSTSEDFSPVLYGTEIKKEDGRLKISLRAASGDIFISAKDGSADFTPVIKCPVNAVAVKEESSDKRSDEIKPLSEEADNTIHEEKKTGSPIIPAESVNKPLEEMTVSELQTEVLIRLAKNGPVTEQMKKDVRENVWQNSLINWVKSFR